MRASRSVWRRHARTLGGLAAPVLLSLAPLTRAAEPLSVMPAPSVVAPAPARVFDLHAAREAAVANQPAVAAARATLTAAQLKAESLDRMCVAALVSRELPIRRKQAALGVAIAEAGVEAAECDARHAATYCYLAVLYARDQQKTADSILDRLTDLKTVGQAALQKGRKDVSKDQIDQIEAYISVVEGRKHEAIQGEQRALAALREAVGMGPDCPVAVVGTELPNVTTKADRDLIVQLAVSRRGEVVQATTAVDVFCLEVDAQGAILLSPARTFASGADIHGQVLLAPLHDPDYRPGAVAPEMPPSLVGNRHERQDQAQAYHARAGAVADKARNLIGLEAEDAFLRWKQYDDEEPQLDAAATKLETYSSNLKDKFDFEKAGYPTVNDLLDGGLKAVQQRLDATQAKFRRLAALANLERITAGGFDPGLDVPAPAKP